MDSVRQAILAVELKALQQEETENTNKTPATEQWARGRLAARVFIVNKHKLLYLLSVFLLNFGSH